MEKDDALRRTDHYRCRRCGQISPLSAAVCLNPGCRAQLGIYGETIQLSEPEKTPVIYPAETPETTEEPSRPTTTHKEEKAAPEQPAPLKKQREKKTAKKSPAPAGKPFMRKKVLLLWLNIIFLLLFCTVAYLCEYCNPERSDIGDVLCCVGFLLPVAVINILLLLKEKYILYVLHGIVCIIGSFLSFFTIVNFVFAPDYTAPLCLVMVGAFLWLGIISFLKPSRKKAGLEGEFPELVITRPFMTKKAVLICLDVLALLLYCAAAVYQVEILFSQIDGGSQWTTAVLLLNCSVQIVFTIVTIIFASKRKYVLHGILYCLCGIANFFFQWSNILLLLVISTAVSLFYLWLGIVSFLRGE